MRTLGSVGLPLLFVLLSGRASFADADAALIQRVGTLLEPRGKIAALTEALGREPDERRDLGFGCGWRRFELHGDELTLRVDVVTRRERVAGIRVRSLDGDAGLTNRIRRAWGVRVKVLEDGIEVRTESPEEMKRVRRAAWNELGDAPRTGVGEGRRAAVETLTDPLAELTFGTVCYEDGSPPPGRELADGLWQAGSRAALDTVLVGANPEGWLYAAEALLRMDLEGDRIGEERHATIQKVLALDVPIRSCAGCEVFEQEAAALVGDATVREGVLCRVLVTAKLEGRTYVERHILVYRDGRRMARRRPAPGVPASIPWIDRASLSEEVLRGLRVAVEAGEGLEVRDGISTCELASDRVTKAPKGIRDVLASLPEGFR